MEKIKVCKCGNRHHYKAYRSPLCPDCYAVYQKKRTSIKPEIIRAQEMTSQLISRPWKGVIFD